MERPTTIRVIPFKLDHLDLFEFRDDETNSMFYLKDICERIKTLTEASLETGTFICSGHILCCTGFNILWPGVADGWIIPSKYIYEHPIAYSRTIKNYIGSIMDTFKCHRFQTVSEESVESDRWMKFLGLEKEGVLRKYTHDKQNFCQYARVI